MRSVLVWLMVLSGGVFVPSKLPITPAPTCHPAELFVTDNTDPLFEIQADVTIAQNGAAATGSTPLDGVYWSAELQQTTSERSREFHLCSPDELTLHALAAALRRQFNQEAVLTFDYLPAACAGSGRDRRHRARHRPRPLPRCVRVRSGRTPSIAGRIRHHNRPHPDPDRRHRRSRHRPAGLSAMPVAAGAQPISPTASANSSNSKLPTPKKEGSRWNAT